MLKILFPEKKMMIPIAVLVWESWGLENESNPIGNEKLFQYLPCFLQDYHAFVYTWKSSNESHQWDMCIQFPLLNFNVRFEL